MDDYDENHDQDHLAAIRAAINEIDENIVSLMSRRERLVRRAGAIKRDDASVRAPARVEQVIANVRGYAGDHGVDPAVVEETYRAMIAGFIELELRMRRAG